MPRSEPPAVLRYGAAIAVVAAAIAASFPQQVGEITPVVSLLLCGVLFAAWFGGLGPGLFALALGLLAFDYFFLPPLYSLAVQSHKDVLRLIAFAIAALFVLALSARQESTAQSLRRSEQNLQTIIDTIPAHVVRYRADGTADFMNHTLREFLGSDVGLDGLNCTVHPDDVRQNWRAWQAHVAAGEPYENEMRLRRADGVYRWHRLRRVPLRDANGAIVNWYGAGHDTDDEKRAETALREREAQLAEARRGLQQTIDTIPILVASYSADARRDFVNAAWKQYTGLSDAAALGTEWSTVAHPDDIAIGKKMWGDTLAKGEPLHAEARLRRADGQYRWHAVDRVALCDESGKVIKWYSTGYDIEDRKRAEDALREREAQLADARRELQATIDKIPALIASLWPNGERDFVNLAWQRFTGISQEEARGTTQMIPVHPDHRGLGASDWHRCLETGEPFEQEEQLLRVDGQYRWHSVRRVPARDENGKVIKWYGIGFDIEDRKRAEDALRRSRTYLAEAQRLSRTGSFGWSIADNIVIWSPETYRIFEIDPAVKPTVELGLGRTHPDDIDLVQRMIERLANEDREFDFEHRLLLPNGTIKHLHLRTHRVRFESGEVEVVGAVMDITAARKAEEALRRAQAELAHAARVATLGELTASIAHEVNQPLASIVASGEAAIRWLDQDVPEKERAHRAIMRLLDEAQRASQVIRRIRELAKKAEPEMAQVDINGLVEDVVTLVHREAVGQRVAVQTQLASELPPALGDHVQLQQVLINLVINGIQAMASVTDRGRVLAIRTQRYGDDELLIAVEDAGVGIAPGNLAQIFGAFYTTKPDGMGMGLSISRSIVEAHDGRIWATRNSGPGTTFQFTLSAYREPTEASSPVS